MSVPAAPTRPQGHFVSGFDVSHWQRNIDWPEVAPGGMEFVFIKATDGGSASDPNFVINWAAAGHTGILRSAYHFFRPLEDPVHQAEAFLRLLGGCGGELAPALDLEGSLARLADGSQHDQWLEIKFEERLPRVMAWLQRVQKECRTEPIIYTSPSFWADVMGNTPALKHYPLWVAHYTQAGVPKLPVGWDHWRFWQFSQSGAVRGVRGKVDLNRFNGSSTDLFATMMASSPAAQAAARKGGAHPAE